MRSCRPSVVVMCHPLPPPPRSRLGCDHPSPIPFPAIRLRVAGGCLTHTAPHPSWVLLHGVRKGTHQGAFCSLQFKLDWDHPPPLPQPSVGTAPPPYWPSLPTFAQCGGESTHRELFSPCSSNLAGFAPATLLPQLSLPSGVVVGQGVGTHFPPLPTPPAGAGVGLVGAFPFPHPPPLLEVTAEEGVGF